MDKQAEAITCWKLTNGLEVDGCRENRFVTFSSAERLLVRKRATCHYTMSVDLRHFTPIVI